MAWTTPATVVTGDIITAAYGNTYVRDNTAYLKSLLDGTGGAIDVKVPSKLLVSNDANAGLYKDPSGNIVLQLDSGLDAFAFLRATNVFQWFVGGSTVSLQIDGATGKLTGAGFYDSGAQSVAATGGIATLSHGLADRPRFIHGYEAASSAALGDNNTTFNNRLGTSLAVTANNTQIKLTNPTGAIVWGRVFAML